MKFECSEYHSSKEILKELELNQFFETFYLDLPALPHLMLSPKNSNELKHHFQKLNTLFTSLDIEGIDLGKLLSTMRKIPMLHPVLGAIKSESLELHHLFTLGNYLKATEELSLLLKFDLPKCHKAHLRTLSDSMTSRFESLKEDPDLDQEFSKLKELQKERLKEISQLEKKIQNETGLAMIYPYPKELSLSTDLTRLKAVKDLKIIDQKHCFEVRVSPTKQLQKLEKDIEQSEQTIHKATRKKIKKINQKLSQDLENFEEFYENCQEKILHLTYYISAKKNSYILPQFGKDYEVLDGILPSLQKNLGEEYVPLNITLSKGSNVLFGHNMAGKTTILKTLYFQTTCLRYGLPVPAKKLTLPKLDEVALHLKNSGSLQKHVSSFGDELAFLSEKRSDSALILIDELFSSTNPISGTELSKIFLEEYQDSNSILFISTQFPEVLQQKGITLYRMQDEDISKHTNKSRNSYIVEKVESWNKSEDSHLYNRPLELALEYPFSKQLIKKLEQSIKGMNHAKS